MIASISAGGAEKLLISTLKYLDKNRFSPFVCCTKNEGPLAHHIKEMGIPVYSLNMKGFFDFKAIMKILKILKTNHINIVHTNFIDIDIVGRILSFISGRKSVSTVHSVLEADQYKTLKWKMIFFTSRVTANLFPAVLIAVSDYIKQAYVTQFGFNARKFITIHNFCDERSLTLQNDFDPARKRAELGLNDDDIVFINVARLHEDKSQDKLMESIAQAHKKNRKIKLVVVGDGPLELYLKKFISDRGLDGIIKMLGYREDIAELLNISDCFILSSKKEGLPIALLEAMLLAKPIIATNVGAISEAIIHKKTGILIEKNKIDELPEIILESIRNKHYLSTIAQEARRVYFEKFSADQYKNKLEDAYLKMMKRYI
jgi:glycosyltransferase involved in cell wall biosynthesis